MMSRQKMVIAATAIAVCLAIVTGCVVQSKNPLSTEKTSKSDLKLLGTWKEKGHEKDQWRIARHPKSENVLMAFGLPAKLDGSPDLLLTTTLGGKKYLSWGGRDIKSGEMCFFVCQYEMPNEDTLNIRFLSVPAIRKAIVDQKLVGKVTITTLTTVSSKYTQKQQEEVRITASTEALRSFLEANADTCFPKDEKPDMVLIRVKKPAAQAIRR